MPLLRYADGSVRDVANQDIPNEVNANGAIPPDEIRLTAPNGAETVVPYHNFAASEATRNPSAQGYTPTDQSSIDQQVHKAELADETSAFGAGARGFAHELSFGLYSPSERQQEADLLHPIAHGVSSFVGAVAPALIPGVGEAKIAQLLGRSAVEGGELVRGASAINDVSHLLPGRFLAGTSRNIAEGIGGTKGLMAAAAFEGGGQHVLRAALDKDVDFSGEALAENVLLGVGIVRGVSAIGKGVSAIERKLASRAAKLDESIDDVKNLKRVLDNKPIEPGHAAGDDIFKDAVRDIPGYSANKAVMRDVDVMSREVKAWRNGPLGRSLDPEAAASIDNGLASAALVKNFAKQAPAVQATVMGRFNNILSDVDEMAATIHVQPNRGGFGPKGLPARFSPQGIAARQDMLDKIDPTGLTAHELAAQQLSARLVGGTPAARTAQDVASGLLSRIPLVGKVIAKGGLGAGFVGAGLEHIMSDAEHSVLGGVIGLGVKGAAVVGIAKGIRKLSESPATNAIVSSLTADAVTRLTGAPKGSLPKERHALAQSFIDHARALSPDEALKRATVDGQHLAHISTDVLASLGAAAQRRQALILQGLDSIVPPQQVGAMQLRRQHLTGQQVRQVDSIIRIAQSPTAFASMLASDSLDSKGLQLASQMWPAHVARAKSIASDWLSRHDGDVPRTIARRLELLLGPQGVGSQNDDSARAAQASIAAAKERSKNPPKMPQPSGDGGRGNPAMMDAGMRAAVRPSD